MINLIPTEEKKEIIKDFYLRLLTVIFLMLSCVFIVGSISILPSHFLSSIIKNTIDKKLEAEQNYPSTLDKDTATVVSDEKNKLNIIENAQKSEFLFSDKILNEIILRKISGIKLTDISYQKDSEKGANVNVSGIASTRETLLLFRQNLEQSLLFSKVDLPISNFVKDSNIRFNLSLQPSK